MITTMMHRGRYLRAVRCVSAISDDLEAPKSLSESQTLGAYLVFEYLRLVHYPSHVSQSGILCSIVCHSTVIVSDTSSGPCVFGELKWQLRKGNLVG